MPKTIHWPKEFEQEVLLEPLDAIYLTVRPGRLYYETQYFKKGDIVDIRIGNKVVRKALVYDDLRLSQIKNLSQAELNLLKSSINTKEKLQDFLGNQYNLQLDENSDITLVFYKNMNLVHLKENEDPHFC